ncbi:AAA family ATPase [Wolbachia endosymbiont of Litomosoides sigmodontis]|uniref:UvrD-helicase domain-containing protein n=1 Tax=Wolbachia endosymbiont of Litomosoides sigmodontis TaxID=80850 RepID=UPI00158C1386|nr:UvrD-helicase domain-containing protein [Wolbachia endosymbiont of Litomosoides sigmodontis]QKX02970.1 AAA family ATPase [Wolbachia endosymbiont of Litomosoides sigmodontis]
MRSDTINPNFSAWVNASAGTGKTKILIDRVLRLLLENKRNIFCLTFTNAAANEMESRIHSMLSKWAICSDSELIASLEQLDPSLLSLHHYTSSQPYLPSQCSTLESKLLQTKNSEVLNHYLIQARRIFSELENFGLTIQTIHAFCYKLISSFPVEAGIVPNCALSECKGLHSIVFDKLLHNKDIQDSINFIAAEVDENELRDLLYTLCIKRSVSINDLEYIKGKLSAPDEIRSLRSEVTKQIERLAEILSKGSKRDQSYSKMLDFTSSSVIQTENLVKVFLKSESHERKSISSIITKSTLEKFPGAKQIIENIQNAVFTHIRNINSYQIFKRTSSLLDIFKVYINLYNSEKLKNALLDYNDIIDLATNLLSNPDYKYRVLFNLDQKIDHILVDEAQDNSTSQWKIIASLCDKFFVCNDEKRTLFVVGDIKQSIYRFQGANPHLFNHMQQYFHIKNGDRDWISYQLEKSFRSTPEILTLVDRLFNNFREEISFVNSEIKHVPYRENDQGYIEIWPLLPKCKEEEQQALQIHLMHKKDYIIIDRLLAQAIAHKIHNWLNEGRILVAKDRHIEPRDIMILVRQQNVLVDYVTSELKKANIPVVRLGYFRIMDYIAVQDLIALTEFLLLPTNDLALANVLKSPLFNFTEDDLFNIAYDRKEQSLWERLQNYSKNIYNELNDLINLSHMESPLALFTHILCTSKKKFAARLGPECFEVLDEFMNLVLQFENPSLQAFAQWIKENNPEVKNDMQSERNAVQIMTIHKSKGLQAPIVFLIDTNTVPKNNESIIFDAMGAPFLCRKNNNSYCDQAKREKKLEDYSEYLRLLYVALTRAEDELYILGKEPVQKGSWYDLITKYGEPYEKKYADLHQTFKEKVEVLCINANYPYIRKKRDYSNVPVVFPTPNLLTSFQHLPPLSSQSFNTVIHPFSSLDLNIMHLTDKKRGTWITNGYTRGSIIHSILQYMPKIEKDRRKNWIRKYLENINTREDKDEIYRKILAFNVKYDYLFDLDGKSEITLSGTINGEPILVRLDRLCITQDRAIIIDYKSHRKVSASSLNEVKKQMLIYKTLVQEVCPNKQVECIVIWMEDLTIQSNF